jgi:hypothetical protein
MKTYHIFFLFMLISLGTTAQETTRGTIKVAKSGLVTKVVFDNVNKRLIGIDQYGNVLDSAIVEFNMAVTIKGIFNSYKALGPGLTYEMQQQLSKADRTSKITFSGIRAKNKSGEIQKMPDFNYNFGYSDENND